METNFNLGSLKIVYMPLMEYFKKIQNNITDNLILIRDEKKIATNYEFIDILGKVQASLKMIGLNGVAKVFSLIQETSKELKDISYDTPKSIKIWEAHQSILNDIENYIKQLLDGELDQPTKLYSQYEYLAELVNKEVSIKDLFNPKLDIIDSQISLHKELRHGQFINDTNKNTLLENVKRAHGFVQQSLVIMLANIAQDGNFSSTEDKNIHHGACKKIYEVLTQLQDQKISKSYHVLFGIQELLVCTATPVFNDSFTGLVGEMNKELQSNLAKVEKGLKVLIDEISQLESGDKTGSLRASDEIAKENLFFIIEVLNANKTLKKMPVFSELLEYFDYSFYENQLKNITLKVSVSQSNPELSSQIEKFLIDIKEQLTLLTNKNNSESVLNQHVNKFHSLIENFYNLVSSDQEILKEFLSTLVSHVQDVKNKKINLSEDLQKEISIAVLLLEYAVNVLIKKNPSAKSKEEFEIQLNLQKNRLQAAANGLDVSSFDLPVMDIENKESNERKALLKIFEEVAKELKHTEEVLDTLLKTNDVDLEELESIFTPLNSIKGIFAITDNNELSNIVNEISIIWKKVAAEGLENIDSKLLKNSITWLGGISLFVSASQNNNVIEAQEIEEKVINNFNKFYGINTDNDEIKELSNDSTSVQVNEIKEVLLTEEKQIITVKPSREVSPVKENVMIISEVIPAKETSSVPQSDEEFSSDPELLTIFLDEIELVQLDLSRNFDILKTDQSNEEALVNIRRGFHTLKGSGKMVGLEKLGDVAWIVEQELNKLINSGSPANESLIQASEYVATKFKGWALDLKNSGSTKLNVSVEEAAFYKLFNENIEDVQLIEPIEEVESIDTILEEVTSIIIDTPSEDTDLDDSIKIENHTVNINGVDIEDQIYNLFDDESTVHIEGMIDIVHDENFDKVSHEFMVHAHTLASIAQSVNMLDLATIATKLEDFSNTAINKDKKFNDENIEIIKNIVNKVPLFKNKNADELSVTIFSELVYQIELLHKEISTDIVVSELVEDIIIRNELEQNEKQKVDALVELPHAEMHDNFITKDLGKQKEIIDIKANERALELLGDFAQKITEDFKQTMIQTVSELTKTISSLQQEIQTLKQNNPEPDSGKIVDNVMNQIDTLMDKKYNNIFEKLSQNDDDNLSKKVNELNKIVETIQTEQKDIVKSNKDGVDAIRRDLRSIASIVKKKSGESYQDIFGMEVAQEYSDEEEDVGSDIDSLIFENFADNELELLGNDSYLQTIFEDKVSNVVDEFDPEIYEISKEEVKEMFTKIDDLLEDTKLDNLDISQNNILKRYLHTLKGSLRMAGANKMGAIAHRLESLLDYSENHNISLFKMKSLIQKEIEKLHFLEDNGTNSLNKQKENWLDSVLEPAQKLTLLEDEVIEVIPTILSVSTKKEEKQYIRVVSNVLDSLINEAGEIRLSRTTLEGTLSNNKKSLIDLKASSNKLGKILKEIEIQAETQISARKDELFEIGKDFDPLEFDRFTRLQELTRFMNETVLDVKDSIDHLDRLYRTQEGAVIQQSIVTNNMLDSLMKIRLIPVDTINDRLYKVTRNTSKEMGKPVTLELYGEKTEMDRLVLESIQSPLEHLVRNCIAHGIEKPEVREANNKPAIGKIKIDVSQDGNFIIIKISDDGAGINLNKVKKLGYDKGLLEEGIEYPDNEIIDLIFKPGFSTAEIVSQVSGRGVGMDIVKNEVFSLGGSIKTETKEGEGTQFTIVLPVAVATNQAMLTEISGKLVAIPAILVDQVVSMKKAKLEIAYEEGHVTYDNQNYPIYYLGHLMGVLSPSQAPEIKFYNTLILISYLDQKIVVHVDKLETTDEILIKQMGSYFGKISGLLGATLLGDGRQGVVVNPVLLKDHFNKNVKNEKYELHLPMEEQVISKAKEVLTVMVVDDSITVRRATSKILEKYGYNIILAKDGEDGLEQLQINLPDIILSDIEMPKMDGFEFVKNVKNIDKYKHIPIVMITSRTADKHKKLAYSLGIDSFLGKPYQEDELIRQILQYTKRK